MIHFAGEFAIELERVEHEIREIHEKKVTVQALGGVRMEIIFKEDSYRIMGACFEVYKEKGSGFLEAVYQECLQIEFDLQGIPFLKKNPLLLWYKGRQLTCSYEPDFICFDKIIVEIKAVSVLGKDHRAQVHNYLKATGYKLGLLINFGHYPQLEYVRIVR